METRLKVTAALYVWIAVGATGCASSGGVSELRQPALCREGATVEVAWPERLYPARVLQNLDDTGLCWVAYKSEDRLWNEHVHPERVYGLESGRGAKLCREGEEVWVDWNGTQWYSAQVTAGLDDAGRCPIHYIDYDSSWDEAVSLERIRVP